MSLKEGVSSKEHPITKDTKGYIIKTDIRPS